MKKQAKAVEKTASSHALQSPAQLAMYLRALRKAKGLTQTQLGTMLGVTRARVSEIERDPANLGFTQLQRILHLLGGRLVLEVHADDERTATDAAPTPRGEW